MNQVNPVSVRCRFTSTVRRDVDRLVKYGCTIDSGCIGGDYIWVFEGDNRVYRAVKVISFLWINLWVVSKYDSDGGIMWI